VRELQNLMERAVLLAGRSPVSPRHFLLENGEWPLFEDHAENSVPLPAAAPEPSPAEPDAGGAASVFSGPVMPLHEVERLMILKGLEATSGNRTQAAELLGISVRTLRNKLNEYRAQGRPVEG
jgi:DNA-binding NtrC family response regulator